MKKRVKFNLIFLSTTGLVLYMLLSLFVINRQATSLAHSTLENYLSSTLSLAEYPDDAQEFVKGLSSQYSGDVRITLIAPDGTVLGDSQADPGAMPNHADREEIAEAVQSGYGEDVRSSETTGTSTMYAARTWDDGTVLRFAIPLSSTRDFMYNVLPIFLVLLLLLCVIITVIVDRFAKRLAQPYEQMLTYIEVALKEGRSDIEYTSEYEELQPIIRYFHYLLEQISGHIAEITAKTAEIENIVSAMQEGLVLLDEEFNILLINPQGSHFMSIPRESWQRKITYLYRNQEFADTLALAARERSRQIVDIKGEGDSVHRFFITPVPDGGYVLLISDVSELIYLERVRSDFAANVSHELKTPLTSISGFAELIGNGLVSDKETMKEYAQKIHTESQRLVRLIDDILNLSRVENTEPITAHSMNPVDLRGVFAYVLEMLAAQIAEKEVHCEVNGACSLIADKEHLYELALNLCDNAIKYNKQGGSVKIQLLHNGFSVTDTGIGIEPEHQDRIFERFYRADKARSRKTGGTGLGLSIAKHIAVLYGGSITVQSCDEGSTFTVSFPEAMVV